MDDIAKVVKLTLDAFELGVKSGAQQGPMPRYFARLDAAEAVCEHIDKMATLHPREGGPLWTLLAAWRKAKAASEEGQ